MKKKEILSKLICIGIAFCFIGFIASGAPLKGRPQPLSLQDLGMAGHLNFLTCGMGYLLVTLQRISGSFHIGK